MSHSILIHLVNITSYRTAFNSTLDCFLVACCFSLYSRDIHPRDKEPLTFLFFLLTVTFLSCLAFSNLDSSV